MALYSKVEYWNDRYSATANHEPCEWYQSYQELRHLLNPIHFCASTTSSNLPRTEFKTSSFSASSSIFPPRDQCRVLILGCGNSTFGADLQHDGWVGRIVNVDFSPVVIEQMQQKYNDENYSHTPAPAMEFVCADMTQRWPFDDESFDLVVCKGALDAVLCSAGARGAILVAVAECVRVLARGHGIFFLVTNGNPDARIEYLEHRYQMDYYWSCVNVHPVTRILSAEPHGYGQATRTDYVYICRKRLEDPVPNESATDDHVLKKAPLSSLHSENRENMY